MEEPSIFHEPFFPVRRRSLLPVFLKIYIWVGMVLSGILFLLAIFLFVIGISFDDWTGTDLTELSLPLVVAIPYYVMLYKIQYRWEHIAVSKKEALTATPMK